MKVAVISTEKLNLKVKGFNIRTYQWAEIGKKEINLRDFDGVIIVLSELPDKPDDVDWFEFQTMLDHEIMVDILYREGSFIFIVGDPSTNLRDNSVADMLGLSLKDIPGGGDSISKTRHFDGSPYKSYLDKVKKYEYSFQLLEPIAAIKNNAESYSRIADLDVTPYLITRSGYTLAAEVQISTSKYSSYDSRRYDTRNITSGKIVLLPPTSDDLTETLKMLLEINADSSKQDEPEWGEAIKVVGQENLDEKLKDNQKKTEQLIKQRDELAGGVAKLRKPLEVLYKSDKPLEASVKSLLKDMGVKIVEPKSSEKVEFYLEHNDKKFVVEVKSTTGKTLDQKGLRQVIDWQNDAFDETGEEYQPLVIASVMFNKPPEARNLEILPDNLKLYTDKRSITVITVQTLFDMSELIKQGKAELDALISELAAHKGLYVLPASKK